MLNFLFLQIVLQFLPVNIILNPLSDFDIFWNSKEFQFELEKKCDLDHNVRDNEILRQWYPTKWATFANNRYQNVLKILRAFHLVRKWPGGNSSFYDENFTHNYIAIEYCLKTFMVALLYFERFMLQIGDGLQVSTTMSWK